MGCAPFLQTRYGGEGGEGAIGGDDGCCGGLGGHRGGANGFGGEDGAGEGGGTVQGIHPIQLANCEHFALHENS